VYIAEYGGNRIRRIGTDGIITTVLGNGGAATAGDGGAAHQATANRPEGVAVDRAGNVYFNEVDGAVIRRIGIDGIVRRIAGTGVAGHTGDGRSALDAQIHSPNGVSIGNDGAVYFCEYSRNCVRRISPDGIITTVFGSDDSVGGYSGDRGVASKARCRAPNAACFAPDGTMYVAESGNHIIRRVRTAWPGFSQNEKHVLERDGATVHVFDRRGRHLRTEDALTQHVLTSFDYDRSGRMVGINREAGRVSVERDGLGRPISITSPSGRRTNLQIGSDGMLSHVETPDRSRIQFLLANPKNIVERFSVD
jgi:YD repeat-containing protein